MKQYLINNKTTNFLRISETEIPKIGKNEVLVKVKAISLNYRDLLISKSLPDERVIVPGSDGAGEVIKIGSEVKSLKVGDRVAGLFFPDWNKGEIDSLKVKRVRGGDLLEGMLSEYTVGHEDSFVILPKHLSFEEGSTLPCAGVTAWAALNAGNGVNTGDTILIQGTGGVSMLALQLAHARGVNVIVTSSQDTKLEKASNLGANHLINYKINPDWEKNVLEITNGKGVDRVIEVGGGGTLEKSIQATRLGGSISLLGVLTGFDVKINPVQLFQRSQSLHGIYVGSGEMQSLLGRELKLNNIHPVIDRIFEFDQAKEAFEYLASGEHFGKVVIRV